MNTGTMLPLSAKDVRRVVTSLFHALFSSSLWHSNDSRKIDAAVAGLDIEEARLLVAKSFFFFGQEHPPGLVPHPLPLPWLVGELCRTGLDSFNFQTSGSTGTQKTIPCKRPLFESEIAALAHLFANRKRVLSVVPEHHIFGFAFSVFLPKYLGIPVVRLAPLPTTAFLDSLQAGDLVLAFPRFWQALLEVAKEREAQKQYSDALMGISSTAPCPPEVITGLKERLLHSMVEIYGSTETSAVGYRLAPHQPYTLLSAWQKVEQAGQETLIARRYADGTTDPPQNLQDRVDWVADRQFFPIGRHDKAVQVGGVNVYPDDVARVIAAHPSVQECAVRLMRPEEGVRLKAFIVPTPDVPLDACPALFGAAFRKWLLATLGASACPRAFSYGRELPRNSMGKLSDW